MALLVAMILFALPLLLAQYDASRARAELYNAKDALKAGDFAQARSSELDARSHVAAAQRHIHGWIADAWSGLPVVGGAVRDGRHLLDALGEADAIMRIGVHVYAKAMGPRSTLIRGTSVDVPLLRNITASISHVGPHLDLALHDLSLVQGTTPLLGGTLQHERQVAIGKLASISHSYQQFSPLMSRLPEVLGANTPKTYLVTILNPSEQRYSGGATLSMSTLHFEDGRTTFGPSYYIIQLNQRRPFLNWPKVPGNPFRGAGPSRLTAATFSPYWQVSGEELLRAWRAQTGQHTNGLIAMDLQALANLFQVTGPMHIPGYGRLDAHNLVHVLAGSYDTYQNTYQRHQLDSSLIPAFRQKLLKGGRFLEKAQALVAAGAERHFFVYSRNPLTEQAFINGGLGGNLSSSPRDYLGVFSQNLNGSKADYWQRRHVSSRVRLRPDGSAAEKVVTVVSNPAPTYTHPVADPKSGYVTRWLGATVALFLPRHTTLKSFAANGHMVPGTALTNSTVSNIYNRPFLRHTVRIKPDATSRLVARYRAAGVAGVSADGDLTYRLDMDPQGLVNPQTNKVTLYIPVGYHFGPLPAGWVRKGGSAAVLGPMPLERSVSWTVQVLKN